ncbi:MAG: sulfite reductase, assimilatory-type [Nitrospirae bacterium RBG_13_39_12]|nr:MAG: sulfite reductase, assimilatory-type [Nitrospirae bacterium RBG_13_39_12]
MSEEIKGAILQRDKETYAIVPRIPMGVLTPEILEKLAEVARKYKVRIIKITSGQRIALVGIKPEDIENAWKDLGMDIGPAVGLCVHYVQACPGTETCKFGQGDSLGLAAKIEKMYVGKEGLIPAKTKFGISGCKLCCGESYLRDIGALAAPEGWTVVIGGNSGGRPRVGDVIAEKRTDNEAFELIKKCVDYYSKNAKARERLPRFIQRIGVEEFKKNVI